MLPVNVSAEAPPMVTNHATVTGGGAPGASTSEQMTVSSEPATFGIQHFTNAFLDSGAATETRAGSHPYQMRISAQFNTVPPPEGTTGNSPPPRTRATSPPTCPPGSCSTRALRRHAAGRPSSRPRA